MTPPRFILINTTTDDGTAETIGQLAWNLVCADDDADKYTCIEMDEDGCWYDRTDDFRDSFDEQIEEARVEREQRERDRSMLRRGL